MDFSAIFQLRTKKFWWMDVIFYFVISLLIATIFCYVIFLVKNNLQQKDIKKQSAALQTVGTEQQKEYEKTVITYQSKINDFTSLLRNHEFASNVFVFLQEQTMPNVWFKQFSLDQKNSSTQLSGESDDLDSFSRQVATFEKNEHVKSITTLNSSLGSATRVNFNINLVLDQTIFDYISDTVAASEQAALSEGAQESQNNEQNQTASENQGAAENNTEAGAEAGNTATEGEENSAIKSSQKLITSFHLLSNPEVIGTIDETNYTITLDVPYGTDVKSLTTSIVISPGAVVSPESNIVQDFENPVSYTVTAEDGSTQNYEVQVNVQPAPEANNKPSHTGSVIIILIIAVVVVLAVAALIFMFLRKRPKNNMNGINNV